MGRFDILTATLADAPAIAGIYAEHVRRGIATFETEPPGEPAMRARMMRVLGAGWPWLVAREAGDERQDAVLGYIYVAPFHYRSAYRFACENSVYVAADRRGEGIGSALLGAAIERAESCGFRQMIAVIGGPEPASVALHARHGFVERGRLHAVGRKHGRWLEVIYMQRALGPGSSTAPDTEPR